MKLIDLLVQELPKRGGWPDAANYVVQDCDGTVKFSKSINFLHIKAWVWCSNKDGDDWIYGDRPFEGNFHHHTIAQDRNSSIVTRAKYEAALAASDGWIEWHGGECPVDSDAIVEVKYRNQNQNQNQNHYQYNNDRAGDFEWEHIGSKCDIIAYRLHKPDINSRANDDRLEQDLNECIGQDVDVPEWHGDGVPPVGIECEVKWTGGKWEKCEVIFVGTEKVVVELRNREAAMSLCDVKFRPLRTEAEKAMESAKHIIADLCRDSASNGHSADLIMEAIAAGKIPGVKLEDK